MKKYLTNYSHYISLIFGIISLFICANPLVWRISNLSTDQIAQLLQYALIICLVTIVFGIITVKGSKNNFGIIGMAFGIFGLLISILWLVTYYNTF